MTVPFENDTGNIVRKLARKSLKSEKRRNLMVVIAVALASCLICFSIVMALSTRQIEKNHVEDTYEAVYTKITEEDVSSLKGLDDFSRVSPRGQIRHTFTITFTEKRKFALFVDVCGSRMKTEMSLLLRRFRLW